MAGQEEFYRDLCENAHDLIQSVSPEGRILYANRAWREALGYAADEIARLNILEVIHPESRDHCRQALGEVMRGEPLEDLAFAFQARDGRRVEVAGNARVRHDSAGVAYTCGIFREVTVERRLEEELDRFFHLSLDLLCVAGTDGYFKQVNPAFEQVLGYSREELLRQSFLEFVHPDDKEDTLREVARLAEGLPVVDFRNRYRARDGSWRWLAWRSAPLPERGLIYAVARDVTEQIRIEEQMRRQAAELARSNADLEQFAYAASHDLRAPLRQIDMLAEWIEEEIHGPSERSVSEHLHTLRSRVKRLDALIADLLLYHRAGRGEQQAERVDVAAMVRDLAALLGPPPTFTVAAGPGLPVFDTARSPFELVLRNLIANAVKHHDRADGRVDVTARETEGGFEFAVADDGPGIPANQREKIFGMFHTLRSRDEVEGTGIGLSLVKRLVERFGGRVWVESGAPRGARFLFSWPRRLPPRETSDGHDPDR